MSAPPPHAHRPTMVRTTPHLGSPDPLPRPYRDLRSLASERRLHSARGRSASTATTLADPAGNGPQRMALAGAIGETQAPSRPANVTACHH